MPDFALRQLAAAFPSAPLDPDDVLGSTGCATFFADNEQAEAFRALLRDKPWPALDPARLDADHDILFFLEGPGFAALLPAFLTAAISDFDRFSRLAELISTQLTPSLHEPVRFHRRISALSPVQWSAVEVALEVLAERFDQKWQSNPARSALSELRRLNQTRGNEP